MAGLRFITLQTAIHLQDLPFYYKLQDELCLLFFCLLSIVVFDVLFI